MIVNQTNKFYKLKRSNVVGKPNTQNQQDLLTVSSCVQNGNDKESSMEVDAPKEYHAEVLGLLKRNSDLFAKKDLGYTYKVEMKIRTVHTEHHSTKDK